MTTTMRRTLAFAVAALAFLLAIGIAPAVADDGADAPPASEEPAPASEEAPPASGDAPPGDVATEVEEPPPFDPTDPEQILRSIVFPVVGPSSYSPTFGACRDGCTRSHEGIDLMTYGWKGFPVVAAHDGVVTWANVGGRLAGCGLVIRAPDGWSTVYSHLNTDHPGTDDGAAPCFPAGIEVGARVRAGTLVGWVGDAGNAEETPPHLHFEIRHPEHGAVDPMVSLDAAYRIRHRWIDAADLAALSPTFESSARSAYVVPADQLELLATTAEEIASVDVPVVPFDAADPAPAWTALSELAPERIVVITHDDEVPFLTDLTTVADIVELVLVERGQDGPDFSLSEVIAGAEDIAGAPEDGAEAPDGVEADGEEARIDHFTAQPIDSTIVVASPRSPSPRLLAALGDHRVVILIGRRPPVEIGHPSNDHPGGEANRDGLWWPTSDGWRLSDDPESAPETPLAYAAGRDLEAPTLAYLSSRDAAPSMPLWHYQPTSLATKSL